MKPYSILYKDPNIIAVNKPSGVNSEDCVEEITNELTFKSFDKVPKDFQVTTVGTIDRDTSGIEVFGLNARIVRELEHSFNSNWFSRKYLALLKGDVEEKGSIRFPSKSIAKTKNSTITSFDPLRNFGFVTLAEVWAEKENTHQIRRDLSRSSMNIVGDGKYGQKVLNDFFEQQLGLEQIFFHSHFLKIDLEGYNDTIEINCPLPSGLDLLLQRLCCFSHNSVFAFTDDELGL